MRHNNAQWWRISGWFILISALLVGGAGKVRAQVPVFDGIDWVADRGGRDQTGLATSSNMDYFRRGYNWFWITDPPGGPPSSTSLLNDNPGIAVPRWVFPRTSDLVNQGATITVDNGTRSRLPEFPQLFYQVPPAPTSDDQDQPTGDYVTDSQGDRTRFLPLPPGALADGTYDPQQMPHMQYSNLTSQPWTLPDVVPGASGDYRASGTANLYGGFSFNTDPSLPWDDDYAFLPATYNAFLIHRSDGTLSAATAAEINYLPYGSQDVVFGINSVLNGTSQSKAYYSSGAYNLIAGNYAVDLFLPGDGTIISGIAHPCIQTALVRVSWGTSAVDGVNNTMNSDGSFNTSVINQLSNSRLFVVNMGGSGWTTVAAPGQSQAAFPYDGTPADQIVVTIYTLTPESTNPGTTGGTPYAQYPLITADAVRFRSPQSTISAPVAGTPKFNNTLTTKVGINEVLPFTYFTREEVVTDPNVLVPENPLLPVDPTPTDPGYNPLVPDPTATTIAPVFYCIDNQNGSVLIGGVQIVSSQRIRWRYVALPDSSDQFANSAKTTYASPLIANVRCRDGVIRPIVYFVTTSVDGSLGRIYAFDPIGDRTQQTTDLYWVYPSYRPLQVADVNTNAQLSAAYYEYHDPNYKNTAGAAASPFGPAFVPGTYPVTTFGNPAIPDQPMGKDFYYDGEVSLNTSTANTYQVSTNNTLIGTLAGVMASPLVIDDPANSSGPQLLIVPDSNGRVYAFDAGGRGDYSPISGTTPLPGTTQRIWAFPHFGADAYHFLAFNNTPTNPILDDTPFGAFYQSASYDSKYVNNNPAGDPVFTPSADGHLYAINAIRDSIGLPSILGSQRANWNNAQRINWQYPGPNASALVIAPSTVSDISTPTLFPATSGTKYIYFTAEGRVYCLPEVCGSAVNTLQWVFPYTANPPTQSDPNDTNYYDFYSMPPVPIRQADLNLNGSGSGATQDELYVLEGSSGTLMMMDPFGLGGATTQQAYGQVVTGLGSISTPIFTQLRTQSMWSTTGSETATSQAALVFGDNSGSLWGFGAIPQSINSTPTLPIIWSQTDSLQPRDSPLALINGMIVAPSEDGQLRGYGIGSGVGYDQGTLGTGEPAQYLPGAGTLTVDLRTIDYYSKADWGAMGLGPGVIPPAGTGNPTTNETPLRDENGNAYTHTASPATANVGGQIFAADWGDYLYIAAAGIYHAHPQNSALTVYGQGVPIISVVFTLSQPGGAPITYPATSNVVFTNNGTPPGLRIPGWSPGTGSTPTGWPDDLGLTNAEHGNLKIYGMDDSGTMRTLTGPTDSVFPWVATIKIPINPTTRAPFTPGGAGCRVTAQAYIQQTVITSGATSTPTNTSTLLSSGQTSWTGFDLTPGTGGAIVYPNPQRMAAGRNAVMTNPIGLTVRSYTSGSNTNNADMTGINNPNVIGWAGSVNLGANNIAELLTNGDRQSITGVTAGAGVSVYKDLFAPLGMVADGSGATYQAINSSRQPVSALFAVDRSALARQTGYNGLRVQVETQSPRWYGGATSVMNPLPWEILPTSNFTTSTASKDYPSLGANALTVSTPSGQDAIHTSVTLNGPVYHDTDPIDNQNPDQDYIKTRLIQPTALNMSVNVPKYQPANVNRGPGTAKLPDGSTFIFGMGYAGLSGNVRNTVIGPMQATNGSPVGLGDTLAFPAAGYTSTLTVRAVPSASAATVTGTSTATRLAFAQTLTNSTLIYRTFDMGLTVPPNIRIRVLETTVDLGKLPHGAGYTDLVAGFYRQPFSPTGSADYPIQPTLVSPILGGTAVPNAPSPWDDASNPVFGQLFRPFNVISDSNINLVNLRAAKLVGVNGAQVSAYAHSVVANPIGSNQAVSLRLNSDQVNNLSVAPLIAAAFGSGAGVGNIGIVTSFDHMSLIANPSTANPGFLEHGLWPIKNPYVIGQDVSSVNSVNGSLIANSTTNLGVLGWADGAQPVPTIGKPRIGDATGHTATVPDKPHDAPDITAYVLDPTGTATIAGSGGTFRVQSYFALPEIGMAIPVGTPVGTYANPVNIFEDNTPPQWQEWLASSAANFSTGISNDGILNVSGSNTPNEVNTNPTFSLKVTVRESRLTGGYTTGSLPQIDSIGTLNSNFPAANTMPAVWMAPGSLSASLDPRLLFLYWSTNRTANGSAPTAAQPWTLAYSALSAPYTPSPLTYPQYTGDFNFANGNSAAVPLSAVSWWTTPVQFGGNTGNMNAFFPSTVTDQQSAKIGSFIPPFLAGVPSPSTLRMSTPAVASSVNYVSNGYGSIDSTDKEAYLFWGGQVDKQNGSGAVGLSTTTDYRTFYQAIGATGGGSAGVPIGAVLSTTNDPTLVKLSPKPILLKLPAASGAPAQKFLFLFWHAGNGTSTRIFYNSAVSTALNTPFDPTAGAVWGTDTQLPLPTGLVSQSDPYPVYRHVNGIDAVDVAFTGVLKNRQKVEVLLARYQINRTTQSGSAIGSLTLVPLPTVSFEVMSRVGASNTFKARDAFWALGTGANGAVATGATDGLVEIDMTQGSSGQYSHLNYKFKLDPTTGAVIAGASNGKPQLGNIDPASGLVSYNILSVDDNGNPVNGLVGGQISVDPSSGTVTFPQVAPAAADSVYVSYTPYLMRLSTSRDGTNVLPVPLAATAWINDPAFAARSAIDSPGSNSGPVMILDRGPNPRANLKAPAVIFNSGANAPELDRLWVLYRKNDPSGTVKSTIYYKSMRLMIKLPRPFLLGPVNNGLQQLAAAPNVTGNAGPYEVDWVRGRIYFTEVDEGSNITVNYQYYDATNNASGASGPLQYVVAWGDEMSSTSSSGDQTVPENPVPTDQAVNEGQVAAFKDPYLDKLWIFWTSTRSNTTDLYYETIAPQLYPTASNQQ